MTTNSENLTDEIHTCIALASAADALLDDCIAGDGIDQTKAGNARRVLGVLQSTMKKVATSIDKSWIEN